MRIEDQIKEMIDDRFGSVPKFAAAIGMSPQTIYTVLRKGISGGSVGTVLPILAKLGIDANWIIQNRIIETNPPEAGYVDVPLFSAGAVPFGCDGSGSDGVFAVPAFFYRQCPDVFLYELRDSAMDRILPKGCYALCYPACEITFDGAPYLVRVGGEMLVRRIHPLNNGYELRPDSYDPTFPAQTLNYNDSDAMALEPVGRIVWYCLPYAWAF